ncbi:MAG TPA: dihydrolipoamide acetyltransferase family protein, partial [Gammaproteobacteria bacterium]|nr:dihydrolipoamide acetyltransferase family protein [Gammaproteobacteria bacterium]
MNIFKLPDLGEGLPDAEIVTWHVKEGDTVTQDQLLVSMETAKAVVDVPSPYSGKVTKLHGNPGDIIETGKPLVSFEGEKNAKTDSGTVVGKVEVGSEVVQEKASSISRSSNVKVLPAIRALAKKLNVDLTTITPSGPQGTITKEDVEQAHERLVQAGPLELLRGVRRSMAITMQQSHSEVVPVTIFEDADITDWKNKDFTVRLLKAIAHACLKEPALNAWYDGQAMGRRLLNYCNIGLAMDTQEGLFVPVIENVQDKNISELRDEIETLKEEVLNR